MSHSFYCYERTVSNTVTYSHVKTDNELTLFPFASLQHTESFLALLKVKKSLFILGFSIR